MQLTKHAHACVEITKDGAGRLVIDPGAFGENSRVLTEAADLVLVTHEHEDHVDLTSLAEVVAARPELVVLAPAEVAARLGASENVRAVGAGDVVDVAGWSVAVVGERHAEIHRDVPRCQNVGFLVDGSVYHPGDSYTVPEAPVATLLVPTSGPWVSVGEGVDFVRALKPRRAIQIHEILLSEMGQQLTAAFLGPDRLGVVPVETVPVGQSVTL